MRLGFDLDGTVADLQGALAREARRLFPDIDPGALPRSIAANAESAGAENDTEPAPVFSMSSLTPGQQRELWRVVRAQVNFWETLDEIEPGSLARLSQLARERRWEVIFLTSRPETQGDTAQVQSHRWLTARGFELPSVFVVHGSRGRIAASLQLDVLVDDRPENCLDIAIDSKARAILLWRGAEGAVPGSARQLGIGSISSVAECLDILVEVDRADQGTGVVERFKQLLGLKRPPRRSATPERLQELPDDSKSFQKVVGS
jgi:hypothetical protein